MSGPTFGEAFALWLPAKQNKMRPAKNARQVESFFQTYSADQLGNMRLSDIDEHKVIKVLSPVWRDKHDTGKKLLAYVVHCLRINDVFLNTEKIQFYMPRPAKVVTHHAGLPLDELPDLCRELQAQNDLVALLILFCILNVHHSGDPLNERGATRFQTSCQAPPTSGSAQKISNQISPVVLVQTRSCTLHAELPKTKLLYEWRLQCSEVFDSIAATSQKSI